MCARVPCNAGGDLVQRVLESVRIVGLVGDGCRISGSRRTADGGVGAVGPARIRAYGGNRVIDFPVDPHTHVSLGPVGVDQRRVIDRRELGLQARCCKLPNAVANIRIAEVSTLIDGHYGRRLSEPGARGLTYKTGDCGPGQSPGDEIAHNWLQAGFENAKSLKRAREDHAMGYSGYNIIGQM